MLRMLSDKEHSVFTGFSLRTVDQEEDFFEETRVLIYTLTNRDIETYIASGEPFDKAGAYVFKDLVRHLLKRFTAIILM